MASDTGYINYFDALGIAEDAHPGEVHKVYKRIMKKLLQEISQGDLTPDRRNQFLLDMARTNAALFVLKDKERRETYTTARQEVMTLEATWCATDRDDYELNNKYRAEFDTKVRSFLSKYVEEMTLTAGQDKEVVEASRWEAGHARAATEILRYYRHHLYNQILERLPYHEVTEPKIEWDERRGIIKTMLEGLV